MGFGNARDLINAFNVADADPKVLISDLNQYYFKAGNPKLEQRNLQIGKVDPIF